MSLFDNTEIDVVDPSKDYYTELTGPGGKFHREDEAEARRELARAKVESDTYVKRLETEMKGLRDELKGRVDSETSAARLAELVDKLAQAKAPPANNEPPTNENRERGVEWTPEKIEALLETKLKTMTATQRAEANVNKVKTELQKKFGPGYATQVRSQAEALNMPLPSLEKLAQEAPDAFLRLMTGNTAQSIPVNPPSSSVSSGFMPDVTGKRTKSFYDKIKQADPSKYWESKTQNQMHKDAIAMGDTFFDT